MSLIISVLPKRYRIPYASRAYLWAQARESSRSKYGAQLGRASMLVLSRKINQSIMIGSAVRVIVVGFEGDQVKLGIEAPRDVPVHRFEIFQEIAHAGSSEGAPSGSGDGDTPWNS
jgi:carbon storage regulator